MPLAPPCDPKNLHLSTRIVSPAITLSTSLQRCCLTFELSPGGGLIYQLGIQTFIVRRMLVLEEIDAICGRGCCFWMRLDAEMEGLNQDVIIGGLLELSRQQNSWITLDLYK